jgi:hypothetical protein
MLQVGATGKEIERIIITIVIIIIITIITYFIRVFANGNNNINKGRVLHLKQQY